MLRRLFPLLALLPVAGQAASLDLGQRSVQIHGFISQGYLRTTDNNYLFADTEEGTLEFFESGLNFQAPVSDRLHVGAQLFTRHLGELTSPLDIDWAFGDYRVHDMLGLRLGKFKTPIGLLNETRDIDSLRVLALMPGAYDERFRSVFLATHGLDLYGNLPLGPLGDFDYQLFGGLVDVHSDEAFLTFMSSYLPGVEFDEVELENVGGGWGRWNTPLEGLSLGASYFTAKEFRFSGEAALGGGSPLILEGFIPTVHFWWYFLQYQMERLTFTAEHSRMTGPGGITVGDSMIEQPFSAQEGNWYVQADIHLASWLDLSVGYTEIFADWKDRDGRSFEGDGGGSLTGLTTPGHQQYQKEIPVGVRFNLMDNWILKLEARNIEGSSHVMGAHNIETDAEGNTRADIKKHWMLLAAKATFTF